MRSFKSILVITAGAILILGTLRTRRHAAFDAAEPGENATQPQTEPNEDTQTEEAHFEARNEFPPEPNIVAKTPPNVSSPVLEPSPAIEEEIPSALWPPAAPLDMKARIAGSLRLKVLKGGHLEPNELNGLRAAMPELVQLETSPTAFSQFQLAYLQTTVSISDAKRLSAVDEIIRASLDEAAARGLLRSGAESEESTPQRLKARYELDRLATRAVQNLLTFDERQAFNNAFRGILQIDLGVGGDDDPFSVKTYYNEGSPVPVARKEPTLRLTERYYE